MHTENARRTDIPYWDNYYHSALAPKSPSDFAKFVMGHMQPTES